MSDLLHPPSLARTLKAAAAPGRTASKSAVLAEPPDPDADDAAATRAALEACEKAATILRAQLAPAVDSSDAHGAPPPAKRRAIERDGDAVVAAASPSNRSSSSGGGRAAALTVAPTMAAAVPQGRQLIAEKG